MGKIARITNDKKLLLANELIEGDKFSLSADGTLHAKELIEGEQLSLNGERLEVVELIEGYDLSGEVPTVMKNTEAHNGSLNTYTFPPVTVNLDTSIFIEVIAGEGAAKGLFSVAMAINRDFWGDDTDYFRFTYKPYSYNYESTVVIADYTNNDIAVSWIDGELQFNNSPIELKAGDYFHLGVKYNDNFEKGKSTFFTLNLRENDENGEILFTQNWEFFREDNTGCVAEGTLVTLADGSQKAVESLTGDEPLLVWNLETGDFDTAPILFVDSDPLKSYEIIHLYFSDGTEVKVTYEHAFWNFNLNKYVYLDKNSAQYIGHWFNKLKIDNSGNKTWIKVQLTDVKIYDENTTAWSPVTANHLCYYVNGMLSIPGGISGLFNIFEVDNQTLKYDQNKKLADIQKYGLFTYEEFIESFYIPEAVFEVFNGKHLKVAMGKGILDEERLKALIEQFAVFLEIIGGSDSG